MDIIAETSKRIEELERENRELREKLEQVCESNYYFANTNSSLLIDKVIMNEKLEKCKELLIMAASDIRILLSGEYERSCLLCGQNKNENAICKNRGGSCYVFCKWVHCDEVEEVLKC